MGTSPTAHNVQLALLSVLLVLIPLHALPAKLVTRCTTALAALSVTGGMVPTANRA